MKFFSIEKLNQVYRIQEEAELKLIRVRHEEFRKFSSDLEKFRLSVGRVREREFVLPSLRLLKRYRFGMTAAPLGFNSDRLLPLDYRERLNLLRGEYEQSLPRFAEGFANLVQSLETLSTLDENPYLIEITQLATQSGVTLLLKDSHFIRLVEDVLENLPGVEVISESQLRRSSECYDTLVCFGARSWYPQYVFRTPRAKKTIMLTFSWIRGQDSQIYPALQGSGQSGTAATRRPEILKGAFLRQRINTCETLEPEEAIDPDLIVPQIDLSETSKKYADGEEMLTERIPARLFQLDGGDGVFLESTEPSSVLTVDLDEIAEMRVRRRAVRDVERGLFVLLRADYDESGSDYITPVADRILGDEVLKLRKIQRLWKSRLCEAVRQHGMGGTIRTLKSLGSSKANEINLTNWMSEKSIRTQDKGDFTAIMGVIGLPNDAEKIWDLSGIIYRAHKQAGRLIRRILLEKVNSSDLTPLEKLGRMTFELEEIGARPIVAVRVIEISEIEVSINPSRVNKIFDLGHYLY